MRYNDEEFLDDDLIWKLEKRLSKKQLPPHE